MRIISMPIGAARATTALLALGEDRTYPRITVDIPLASPAASGIVKILLPLAVVLMSAVLALAITAALLFHRQGWPG